MKTFCEIKVPLADFAWRRVHHQVLVPGTNFISQNVFINCSYKVNFLTKTSTYPLLLLIKMSSSRFCERADFPKRINKYILSNLQISPGDEYIIMASDGLWDVMSSQTVRFMTRAKCQSVDIQMSID